VRDFRRLRVWAASHRLAIDVYRATRGFPREERFGLTAQLRRSVASVPANIAEGYGRRRDGELCQFLSVAMGSLSEVRYHLILSRDLGYLSGKELSDLASSVDRVEGLLSAFLVHVARCSNRGDPGAGRR
jgi:four helix bundle protein